ncbi:E3 ubiquitin-protein ligase RNF213 [Pteropus medius]|uniref:E3 ubiquitin-protein ligase RNF213 n=1 Tax=Pteropus vampyrus TaxID=132908 RepID=UPI00196A9D71|nr:E3 ubiquitin-protein ligase RNF213 [Pteropus giganteus]
MKCPSCRHVSKEAAPKFCSQCGQRLPSAAPLPDSENDPKVTSAPEGEMECGLELKEEGGPFSSPGTSDRQQSPDEPCSATSWNTYQRKFKALSKKKWARINKKIMKNKSPEWDLAALESEPRCKASAGSGEAGSACPSGGASFTAFADSENDPKVTSAPEGEMECGLELKEEGGPFSSPGTSDRQQSPDEPCSATSWNTYQGSASELFVDAVARTADELEAANLPPSKRRKADATWVEVADVLSADPEQSKKKKKKRKNRQARGPGSPGPSSLPPRPATPSGPNSLANPGFQDAAGPRHPAQQGGPPGQLSPAPGTGAMPVAGSPQGQPAAAPTAAPGGSSPSSPAPEGQELGGALLEAGNHEPPEPSQDGAGPTASACGGGPGKEDRARDLPLPESEGDHAEPRKDPQAAGQLAEAAPSGVSRERSDHAEPRKDPQAAGQLAEAATSGAVDAAAQPANAEKGTEGEVKNKTQKSERPPASTAAPRGHCQDGTAAPGEKAKPEKPEGSARSHVDAVKHEDQKNRKAGAQQAKDSPLSPGEGVMVFFHAILSKDFKFDPSQHQVFIRGGEELGKPKWNHNFCTMHYSKDLGQHGTLVEGSGIISRQHLDKPIPYKYVFSRAKGPVEYEFIYKLQKQKHEHVNRCLQVKSELLGADADWHQYDDIICMKPPGQFQRLFNHIWDTTKKNVMRGKQIAACVMLDRLLGVLQTWNAINLRNFFTQFKQFYFVVHMPTIHEGNAQPWQELQYEEKQVKKDLWDHLTKQVAPFQEGSGDPLPEDRPVKSKLRMGLIILNLVENFDFPLSPDDLALLCTLLCSNANSPDAFHRDLSCIFETSPSWRTWLVNLCQRSMDMKVDLWVGTLPVLHRCMERSPPGRDARTQPEDTWAALEGISFSEFRERRADQEQLLQLMEEKKHLLEVDEHLFRSWFSLLPLGHLASYMGNFSDYLCRFPSRVLDCLLGTSYRLRGLRELSNVNLEDVENVLKMLLQLLDIYQDKILEEPLVQSYLTVCLRIHEAICRLTKDPALYEMPALSAEIVCRIILNTLAASAKGQGNGSGKTSVGTVIQAALNTTRTWLGDVFRKRMFQPAGASPVKFTYHQEVQVWRRLVEIDFPREHGWKEILLQDMEGRLKQEDPLSQISAFCNISWAAADSEDSVAKCFENCVIEAVSSACQSQTSVLEGLSYTDLQKFCTLVSAVITKSWPRRNGEAVDDLVEVLKHLLTWPDIKHLFKLYGTDEKILANLTEDGKKLMATADSVFTKVTGDLLNRTILVGHLELIENHVAQFLDIWELSEYPKSLSSQEKKCDMKKVLECRENELSFLKRERSHVDSLLRLCRAVKPLLRVDVGEIARRHSEDLGSKRLNDAVSLSPASDFEWTTHYNLSVQVQEMAEQIDFLKDSHIFRDFWAEAAKSLSEREEEGERSVLQLEDVYHDLYFPCFVKFVKLYNDLKSGEVTFAEVDVVFKVFVDNYSALTADLQIMCTLDSENQKGWIKKRVEQIMEYHHLHQAVSSAEVILKVKENLGLTGDFSVLHSLLRFTRNFETFRHEKLDQISQQLIHAKKLLQDINEARYQCLQELSLRKDFICWVREALGGINELKVFVDLASISAGENDIDVDRVACFHDAVQGYTSLLHKLDRSADFHAFTCHLRELWKALENDQHLPSKLRDSARNLEWLKTVKESHGSVELSSLSLATAINNRGIYVIQAPRGGPISPDTVLHLLLPESHAGQEEVRRYSLEELGELLNKLMLMSGKKDHNSTEVEVFSEVFCNVQRLVQAFISLHSAGNMLFQAWTAEVYCSPRRDVSIRIDFGVELLSQLSGPGPVAQLLEALCRQMERFLDQWQGFVAEKRAEHFHLNYYTAEQLVYLSAQLGSRLPSDAALAMLSFIKRNCTPQNVWEACRSLDGRAARCRERTVVDELPQMVSCEPNLVDKLRVIMEQSLACMSAFLPHCLDLEVLGCCLARLARMAGPPVTRQLPKGLQVGQPNLIVCGHSEVMLAALAIYMHSPQQPLPSYDEVLLCTPETTFEEVALLLRRCLCPGSPGRGVYSLLFADQLSYEVACRAETLLLGLCTQPHREDYQLVMVCDSEREHCYLPSAFSQHKVPMTLQAPLEDIQAYLARHYRAPERTPSAAAVFRDRTCVGIVASRRAGVGKSLYVRRLHDALQVKFSRKVPLKTVRLIDPRVDESAVLGALLPFLGAQYQARPVLFHLDVTSSVKTGIWELLFKLLVLQYLMDINGKMWLRNPCHLYIVEILEGHSPLPKTSSKRRTRDPQFSFLDIFPKVTCRPPKDVIDMELNPQQDHGDPGMDQREFCSETFQRPFQYLRRFHQQQNLDEFQYRDGLVEGSPGECLQYLLIYCGVIDPSWSELWNFARFLNYQLQDCEASVFCNPNVVGDTLRGFKNFVVTFMILMARDFATPTLHMSDQSPGKHEVTLDGVREEDLAPFSLRRRWESEPHPYVFFNDDHTSMTFIGFHLQLNESGYVDAVDRLSKEVIKKDIMTQKLYEELLLQRVPFNVNFDALPRHEKLEHLCQALGIQWPTDPDETYELTTDNMLKILAIEMRFRCGIPVVIMGETGCGKTRLIKFLSDLRRGDTDAETMRLVKVHGGTTADAIYSKVTEAEELALLNKSSCGLDTILFFDEANTTEAVSCIKEVLCDRTVDGRPLVQDSGLHVIAACNPYRMHSAQMIARLESAGLGYRVSAQDTADRLGSIPLRQLVYRVHALPPSLIPLVWDFGQLNDIAEKLYIQQIVQRLAESTAMGQEERRVMTEVLSASQAFMRTRQNECGFVSLRDVERCVRVFRWFYDRSETLLPKLDAFLREAGAGDGSFERHPVLWSLVLALGVCYHASLEKQIPYWRAICRFLPEPYGDSKVVLGELARTQDLFLSGVPLRKTIARNLALKENVFMMVICIELRIPLFLVGKPGSSKSLAKTIVADAMQGQAAHSDLFRGLKQAHLVSFQCSPHSTPQGVVGTFRQCARFQQGKDLQQYAAVVVLDEVGLAEDSPRMPLKALHPLLEDGCIEDDPAPHKKVGFVGISNWALDPAKMNRGIFVSRGSPSKKELIESARGICASEPLVRDRIQEYFAPFAVAYQRVCTGQGKEFFGLRDYYGLIKMLFATAKASRERPSPQDIAQAVLRNFSGRDGVQALDIFTASLPEVQLSQEVSTLQLIRQNVCGGPRQAAAREADDPEARYLLVLTRNYVALQVLQQTLFHGDRQPEIIFGSSFPRDQEYTQVCRNINRVKVCMETGRTAVLLNLQSLYESLYDALNQYYVCLGGQRYVDLGLGTHRVKCRVHPDFRLIVIEEKDVVYKHFPIPLINRLEKHYLDIHTVLERWQKDLVEKLKVWVENFVDVKVEHFLARGMNSPAHRYSAPEAFIGYHSDACASVVLRVTEGLGRSAPAEGRYCEVLEAAKLLLLDCATPDAVVRLSLSPLGLSVAQALSREYYGRQPRGSFADFVRAHLRSAHPERRAVFTEITTFSRLLTSHDCELLAAEVKGQAPRPTLLSLQQFDTELSFLKEVRNCLTNSATCKILIIQTEFEDGVCSAQLVASAKYSAINEINKTQGDEGRVFVYFITKLSRMESGTSYVGFHGGLWQSVHIDDLRRATVMVSNVTKLQNLTISQLFNADDRPEAEVGRRAEGGHEEPMETESGGPEAPAEVDMETEASEALECEPAEPGGAHTQVLDTGSLLRSCVQSAVGMLRDQHAGRQRGMRRVQVLLGLLQDDTAPFSRVAKMRLHDLLKKQEETYVSHMKQWVAREAANPDALQEAGTFRHTLWRRVQGVVTPLLASMVSVIDRDGNLELLTSPETPSWAKDLWMFIFNDIKLLNIPLVTIDDTRSQSEMSYILVQSPMDLSENVCCDFPFSWRIKDYLEELWAQAQYITEAGGLPQKLVEIFQQTPLGRFLAQRTAGEQRELSQCYLRDFLLLTVKVSTCPELKFLQMALSSCINELKAGSPEEDTPLPWVHLAYQHFRIRLQNFSRILTIHSRVLDSLARATQSRDLEGHEMTLDVFAALACVELLTRDLLKPSPQEWLRLVKTLSVPLGLLCSDGYLRDGRGAAAAVITEVRTHWNRIFSIALFVEHVLLGTQSQVPELSDLVTEYVFLLDKCLQGNSDIKTHKAFITVMSILCECKDHASKTLTRFGVEPCPICLGDAQDPVCLPCDHVFCLGCVRTCLTLGQMHCPYCLTELPDSFSPEVSQENRDAIEKHARFRQMCTSFFVDLVSTMCFKDNSPPQKDVVQVLLSLLFVQKKHLRDAPERHHEHTKSLSPFDDVVDKTPVIRSVVLKLLLKYSFPEVKDYIQDYLSQLEEKAFLAEDRTELYVLVSSCLEDSMHEKNSASPTTGTLQSLREDGQLLTTYLRASGGQDASGEASVEYLQAMARIRLCLDRASDVLYEAWDGSEMAGERQHYLRQVKDFCTRAKNDWYRVYLVRKLTDQYGMEFVQSLSRPGHPARWVFPEEVLAQQEDHPSQMDRFLVHGPKYKAVRDAVGTAVLECSPLAAATVLEACGNSGTQQAVHLLLALFREVTTLYTSRNANLHPKPEQCEAMNKVIEESKIFSPEMRHFATSLVTNALPLLRMGPRESSLESTVTEMAIHAAIILLCGQNKILEPLKNLAFFPDNMAKAFLPTMPEDLLAQARNWKGLEGVRWYNCPNGHLCSVGECGMPMEQGSCVDCGAPVGGMDHKPEHGFTAVQSLSDRTQTGHVLGSPPPRGAVVVSDRELSPAVFLLIRLLTHLALLLGAAQSPQALVHIIKPPVRDPREFLQQHIRRDLEQLTQTLGKGADETTHVVHLILHGLLREQHHLPGHKPLHFDANLSTKEKRNHWEKLMEMIILSELAHLDRNLLAVNALISRDERISSSPVARIVFGDPAAFLPHLPRGSVAHSSKMWSCRRRVTVGHLRHLVEQVNGKETVPILWKFLQKVRPPRVTASPTSPGDPRAPALTWPGGSGIPTLVYRRDRNYEHLFLDIRNKMPQDPLPNMAISAISGQLQSYTDACEALHVTEVTLGFLSTAGEDPNMDLALYIQDKLRMSEQTEQVLKALHRCQLRHAIALWQLLSAHKSEQLLRLRKEPFGEINAKYRADLSPENTKLLSKFLNQISLDAFLLELHEMMILKLKNLRTQGDFNPNWSLRDTLVSYMETKDSDALPEMESQFPDQIPLSNCVAAWKLAAQLKRDRQMR